MTNEEFERKIEFIVNQQAQFTVDIQKLQEAQAVTGQEIANTNKVAGQAAEVAGHAAGLAGQAAGLAGQAAGVAARAAEAAAVTAETLTGFIKATHDGFRDVFESFKHTDAKINALVDSQMLTDEKLRELDRRTRKGHKGHNGALEN